MKKKPAKVGESPVPYVAKPATKASIPAPKAGSVGVRYMDDATFSKAADKVFKVHEELLRKLAQ